MKKEIFEKLVEGYLQNTLSQAELNRLMQEIKSDEHDDFIKEKIYALLQENVATDSIDQQKDEHILKQILSQPTAIPPIISIQQKRKKRKSSLYFIYAAATITVLIALGSVFFYKEQSSLPSITIKENTIAKKDILAFNGKQVIHLPDGSTIILNDNSSIEYDQKAFNDTIREVTLLGEAYFDIKRNEKKPFIVHTGKVSTKVLGTAFNINAYGESDKIKVTVERGKVQVGDTQKIYGVITPNEQITVNKNTLDFEQKKVKVEIATAWKSNYLILDNINMEEATSLISQKYKVSITLSNQDIKNCRITASFLNDEDLEHILKVVCSVIEANYHYNSNGSIVLEGKGCQ
ncbi:FecR family protein [Flavobacterium sp. ov086]|jgi:hypothetical protein|uniref:FecR family protein n=1 Tax=Flavobacterium sp. ov086 TaxID=1761785 RepID=UPI000B71CA47|nr:FecR family protein [Flavobacterium sp. ov086]SNR76432.1 FecR family protein [Flavobacterium sp. ov086]